MTTASERPPRDDHPPPAGPKVVRVLVVDDSSLVREVLARMLESDPEVRVVGFAADGREAVAQAARLRPDLITMDISMPRLGGLEATEEIMAYHPTPILIVTSAQDRRGVGWTMDALARGALEVIEKPSVTPDGTWDALRRPLVEKVKLLAGVRVITHLKGRARALRLARAAGRPGPYAMVAVGVSTGGPGVLARILRALPGDFPLGMVVVQHISEGFTGGLVEWLTRETSLRVRLARDGDVVAAGTVLIAPEGVHTLVQRGGRIRLSRGLPVGGHRPSADVLFQSVAATYRSAAIGVLLTGMGTDGALGLEAIRKAGGRTLVQDEETSAVFGMPKAAIDLGAAEEVLPPDAIALRLVQMASIQVAP